MTLDPVHFDGISRIAEFVEYGVDVQEHRQVAEKVWSKSLDPLLDANKNRVILESLDGLSRHRINIEDAGLAEQPFETQHAVDAGTINPTQFKNGLVVDVAQAAMATTPSDLDLHRSRTVVSTFHSNNHELKVNDEWHTFDDDYSRMRAVKIPPLSGVAGGVVHALALYYAESEHARVHSDAVSDLLILDGPIYPRGMLRWGDRNHDASNFLIENPSPTTVLENYVRLIEEFEERGIPLAGFVKNPQRRMITRAVKRDHDVDVVPWADDAAFFTHVLEVGERVDDVVGERWERDDSALTYTNWFRSRGGTDQPLSTDGNALGIEKKLPDEDYEVTFFVVYDPRRDLIYRVEAPYVFTKEQDRRDRLTLQLLQDVAVAGGPPQIVKKADELAKIGRGEKDSLKESLEKQFNAPEDKTEDDYRWPHLSD
ncbi:DNA double-strand break repair nuclease NurA [Natrinema salsiterrestre]|uniref:DNA double-strand break repair nuclease NurA n=1 Tax=Natrinema salsiterrestre TaxID=2950540 RepID=A0A9Q4Q2K5_9EURY|nr:DNA double-strand break repair nuclease NurA [Natrinema salsiterrestre]MDF9748409.1 DNA double-strand break repair nuclease NurA [Natrinema salsiterrestre]